MVLGMCNLFKRPHIQANSWDDKPEKKCGSEFLHLSLILVFFVGAHSLIGCFLPTAKQQHHLKK